MSAPSPLPPAAPAMAFDAASLAPLGVPVTSLALDSRRVRPGDVFVACPGLSSDGRSFIAQAIARGAKAVLWESSDTFRWDPSWQVPNLPINGLQQRLGALASHVYGHPSQSLWVIAVTGTNGKTSVTRWIAQALTASGRKCAVVGTLGAGYVDDADTMDALANTTPDAVTLQAALARFVRDGAKAVAVEASSIALDQHRLDALKIDIAVFTNLTRDHLDYHPSFEAYGEAKAMLFDWPTLSAAVINLDDAWGRTLAARVKARGVPVLDFGLAAQGVQIAAHDLQLGQRGLSLQIVARGVRVPVQSALLGAFNVSNLLATAGALIASDTAVDRLADLLGAVDAPPGRMQPVQAEGMPGTVPGAVCGTAAGARRTQPLVVVDYAHTPDALANALTTLRAMLPAGGRLFCVFGCGGDRDPGKRPLMGEVAARLADQVWVTSDNPRSEAPERIIDEVIAGAAHVAARVHRIVDRAGAIERALTEAAAHDIVLIAGKGHETWQEVAGVRHPFDDRVVAARMLAARHGSGG